MTCFPRTFEANRHKLVDDALVICRARVEETAEDELRTQVGLILEEVLLLEEALERFDGGLVIQVGPRDRPALKPLTEILRSHRGERRIFLEVEGEDGVRRRVRANQEQGVRISSALVRELEAVLGESGRVQLARI